MQHREEREFCHKGERDQARGGLQDVIQDWKHIHLNVRLVGQQGIQRARGHTQRKRKLAAITK